MSYSGFRALAARLIGAKGTLIAMVIPVAGTVDVATNTATGASTITGTVSAVILPGPHDPNLTFEEKMMIRQNVRTLYVAATSLPAGVTEIPPDTAFTFLGSVWRAQGTTEIAPDDTQAIMHTVIVKR